MTEEPTPTLTVVTPAYDVVPGREAVRGSRLAMVLRAAAVLSVVASLAMRDVHRAGYYAGWDLLGSAEGLFLVSTRSARELFHWYVDHHYDGQIAWSTYGLPVALLPGWLASIWPSDRWPSLVTLGFTLLSLSWVGRAVELQGSEWAIVPLAWGASSTLLSWSIAGFGYMSGVWPHALALWTVLRWRRHWFATAILALLAIELSWQGQELGRTVFLVFLAAALFVRPAPGVTRAVWLAAGGWALWDVWRHPTFNSGRYSHLGFGSDAGARLHALAHRFFVEDYLDVPVLFALGLASVLLMRRNRWFWRTLLGAQVGLVVVLSLNSGILQGVEAVWPRRVLLLDFVCLAAVVALYHEHRGRWLMRAVLISALVAGNVWQLRDTWRWARQPLDRHATGSDFPLPYTQTTLDYGVPFELVDWARDMRADVERGKRVILVYNFSSYDENATNPAGVLERLYLTLGHDRFQRSVFVFGTQMARWNDFPIRPLREVERFAREIRDPAEFVGYYRTHPWDWPEFGIDATATFKALGERWDVVWDADRPLARVTGQIHRFTLRPYPAEPSEAQGGGRASHSRSGSGRQLVGPIGLGNSFTSTHWFGSSSAALGTQSVHP